MEVKGMLDSKLIEQIIKEVMASVGDISKETVETVKNTCSSKVSKADYPLGTKRPELIKNTQGKTLDSITLEKVMNGEVVPDDLRISAEVLDYQAQVAESVGRDAFARNLRRAGELTVIPDERILEIYNALRPYRSTKAELMAIGDELEQQYGAKINAALVREAANVYQERKRLKESI
jgi:propanediol dehydratase small subunit